MNSVDPYKYNQYFYAECKCFLLLKNKDNEICTITDKADDSDKRSKTNANCENVKIKAKDGIYQ